MIYQTEVHRTTEKYIDTSYNEVRPDIGLELLL